jgi:hypothetical protein
MSSEKGEKIILENTNDFNFVSIYLNDISSLNWIDTNYINKILELDIYSVITTNSTNFLDDIIKNLDVNKYNEKADGMIETQLIAEFPEYIYEMLYINNVENKDEYKNDLGSLLITNGEKVFGNAIILKTYLPNNSENILFVDSMKEDIKLILENRIKTKIVIYDGEWSEIITIGNLEDYAKDFFDDTYLKIEIPFLKHNINIWYEKLDGCKYDICGKILEKPIYKCLWFTMISNEYRGSLSLDEVKKIIALSYKLNFPYESKKEWDSDEKDKYGRNKIKNKYRILEKAYHELISHY